MGLASEILNKYYGDSQDGTEASSGCSAGLCTKPEFMKRYIDRIKPLALTMQMAIESAEAAFEQWDKVDTPEDCADYEMECWAADA
jgi:hypothetical protein